MEQLILLVSLLIQGLSEEERTVCSQLDSSRHLLFFHTHLFVLLGVAITKFSQLSPHFGFAYRLHSSYSLPTLVIVSVLPLEAFNLRRILVLVAALIFNLILIHIRVEMNYSLSVDLLV